jgi:hypothetical protein
MFHLTELPRRLGHAHIDHLLGQLAVYLELQREGETAS